MPTRTFISTDRKNRLIISTILNHWVLFHEAGFEYTTEKKRKVEFVWWNPSTWSGEKWEKSRNAIQPSITEFKFIQGRNTERDPMDFSVSVPNRRDFTGHFKSSCVFYQFGASGQTNGDRINPSDGTINDLGNDARSVNNVIIEFTYEGSFHRISHSG